jgi:hypothetical protein
MTTARLVGVLLGLAVIGIAIVAIRVDQSRVSQRIQKHQSEQANLSREIWTQEMEMARLRSPQAIRAQAGRLGLEVAPKPPEGVRPVGRRAPRVD